MSSDVRLIEPSPKFEAAYKAFTREFRDADKEDYLTLWDEATTNFPAYLRRLAGEADGENLPEGYVPQNTYWLVDEAGEVVGEIRVRHRLTPKLEDFGGHIGYTVRPSRRRKGCGTRMLALAMEKAPGLGLKRLLITCDPANVASARIIEKNGGRLTSRSIAYNGRLTSRYWIDLAANAGRRRSRKPGAGSP